jgi:hypothetical protein
MQESIVPSGETRARLCEGLPNRTSKGISSGCSARAACGENGSNARVNANGKARTRALIDFEVGRRCCKGPSFIARMNILLRG